MGTYRNGVCVYCGDDCWLWPCPQRIADRNQVPDDDDNVVNDEEGWSLEELKRCMKKAKINDQSW